jgi:hypothetical protein
MMEAGLGERGGVDTFYIESCAVCVRLDETLSSSRHFLTSRQRKKSEGQVVQVFRSTFQARDEWVDVLSHRQQWVT